MEEKTRLRKKPKRCARADMVIEPAVKKQKITNCRLLQTASLPYDVIFETEPNIIGVYKIAFDKETIFVSGPSTNVIKQLRRHFTKHGNSDVCNFMRTLSEDQKQKITVFWLDEKVHDHKCGKTYLKCIETIQGSKPRFNTRKTTNESHDSQSRVCEGTSSFIRSSYSFQNGDDTMLEPDGTNTTQNMEQDISTVCRSSDSVGRSEAPQGRAHQLTRQTTLSNPIGSRSVPQRLSAMPSLQEHQTQSSQTSLSNPIGSISVPRRLPAMPYLQEHPTESSQTTLSNPIGSISVPQRLSAMPTLQEHHTQSSPQVTSSRNRSYEQPFTHNPDTHYTRRQQGSGPSTYNFTFNSYSWSSNKTEHRNEAPPSREKDETQQESFSALRVVGYFFGFIVGCEVAWVAGFFVFMVAVPFFGPFLGLLIALWAGCYFGWHVGFLVGNFVGSFLRMLVVICLLSCLASCTNLEGFIVLLIMVMLVLR